MSQPMPKHPFLSGVWEPWPMEGEVQNLPVTGEIPRELFGALYRNGPNPQFAPRGGYHPFSGDGMIHGFFVRDGRVDYRNRWVRTPRFDAERAAGEALWSSFMGPSGAARSAHRGRARRTREHQHRLARREAARAGRGRAAAGRARPAHAAHALHDRLRRRAARRHVHRAPEARSRDRPDARLPLLGDGAVRRLLRDLAGREGHARGADRRALAVDGPRLHHHARARDLPDLPRDAADRARADAARACSAGSRSSARKIGVMPRNGGASRRGLARQRPVLRLPPHERLHRRASDRGRRRALQAAADPRRGLQDGDRRHRRVALALGDRPRRAQGDRDAARRPRLRVPAPRRAAHGAAVPGRLRGRRGRARRRVHVDPALRRAEREARGARLRRGLGGLGADLRAAQSRTLRKDRASCSRSCTAARPAAATSRSSTPRTSTARRSRSRTCRTACRAGFHGNWRPGA